MHTSLFWPGTFRPSACSGDMWDTEPRFIPSLVCDPLLDAVVGSGAALTTGCVVGNIISGIALVSAAMVLFTVAVTLANWAGGARRGRRWPDGRRHRPFLQPNEEGGAPGNLRLHRKEQY